MIPLDIKNFINIMSLVIFGGILFSALFTLFAYALAINRRKVKIRPPVNEIEDRRMPPETESTHTSGNTPPRS